jgi:hypothetical protein
MNETKKPKSLFFPMLLIAVGVFIFLINIGSVPGTTWENLVQYWPVILIIGGLDGLYKHDGWVGPLVLLGFGTLLLLGNLHYLQYGGFALLLRLWPVLLVAIGLDVILGHRGSIWSNLIRIFLGLVLVGAIVWLATLSPFFSMGMKAVPFDQTLDNATQSDLTFSVAVGQLNLAGGAAEDMLVSGTAGLPREMTLAPEYTSPKNGKSELVLEGNGVVILPINSTTSPWNFDLNSSIPIQLNTDMGVGDMQINLSGTNVNQIDTEMGVGLTTLTLPLGVDVKATVSGAVGELVIRVPKGSNVTITIDKGLIGTDIPNGYVRKGSSIRSPQGNSTGSKITINADLAVGSLVIEEY